MAMSEQEIKKISLEIFKIENNIDSIILELKQNKELDINKELEKIKSNLSKIDSEILKLNNVRFSKKTKEEILLFL